jgi:plasmid stabilization system protein ParE
MKYQILYSPRSRRDLARIRHYIASESGSPAVADQFVGKLFDACNATSDTLPKGRSANRPTAKKVVETVLTPRQLQSPKCRHHLVPQAPDLIRPALLTVNQHRDERHLTPRRLH